MANNPNRQPNAGGGGGGQQNEHVEFTVRAAEDLYLTGSESTIRRVAHDTNYSCLMLKTQRFSSLFRHYAKYHGLRKEDLEYCFVNRLEGEDTPESVQLQRGDIITVRKKRKPEPPSAASDDKEFFKDMKQLLNDKEHADTELVLEKTAAADDDYGGVDSPIRMSTTEPIVLKAHSSILTARSEYFKNALRPHFKEGMVSRITISSHISLETINRVLEFLYTNRIEELQGDVDCDNDAVDTYSSLYSRLSLDDLVALLAAADYFGLRDLKALSEHALSTLIDVPSVVKLYCATDDYNAKRLAQNCINFIMDNLQEVTNSKNFYEQMEAYPQLSVPILKAAAAVIPHNASTTNSSTGNKPASKKQKLSHGGGASHHHHPHHHNAHPGSLHQQHAGGHHHGLHENDEVSDGI